MNVIPRFARPVLGLLAPAATATAQRFVPYNTGLPAVPPGTASDAGWSGIAIRDVDVDGAPDVVAAGRKGTGARVFRYQGAGAFLESSTGLARSISGRSEVAVADFNDDTIPDIVEADFGGHFQNVNGTFTAMPNGGWPFAGEGIAAGDMNGDGRPDVAITGPNLYGVDAADFDGDSSGVPPGAALSNGLKLAVGH